MDAFTRDCIEIAVERLNSGALDRRTFLGGLAALGVPPVILEGSEARADAKEIVGVNWGGDALKYFASAWGDPYTKDTGIKVVWDGTGPAAGKMKAMLEAKNVAWDRCDSGSGTCLIVGKQGYLDEFDYSLVDKTKLLRPQFA